MPIPGNVISFLAAHHAVISRNQARELGMSRTHLDSAIRRGELVSCGAAVYRVSAAPQTDDQRLAIACAVDPCVVVSHRTAGRIFGLRRLGPDRSVHVTIPEERMLIIGDVTVHRAGDRLDPDVIQRADGIRHFNASRTLFDLATVLQEDAVRSVFEQMLHEQLATVEDVRAVVDRRRQRGRTGSRLMRELLEERAAGTRPVASDLERRIEAAIIGAGIASPDRQVEVIVRSGQLFVLDFYWPSQRLAVEVDGTTWHAGYVERSVDYRRDRQLEQIGIRVLRVGEAEAREGLFRFIDDLRLALDGRSTVQSVQSY
jgi:very-short-patch-repair endonuclease